MSSNQIILYERPASCSDRVKFLLEELRVPYEKITSDLPKGERKSPNFIIAPTLLRIKEKVNKHLFIQNYILNILDMPSIKKAKKHLIYKIYLSFIQF